MAIQLPDIEMTTSDAPIEPPVDFVERTLPPEVPIAKISNPFPPDTADNSTISNPFPPDAPSDDLHSSLLEASLTSPDAEVKKRNQAQALDVPTWALPSNPEAALFRKNALSEAANNPKLSKWLTNPDNAKIASDDLHNLAGIEHGMVKKNPYITGLEKAIGKRGEDFGELPGDLLRGTSNLAAIGMKGVSLAAATPLLAIDKVFGTTLADRWFATTTERFDATIQKFNVRPDAGTLGKASHMVGNLVGMVGLAQLTMPAKTVGSMAQANTLWPLMAGMVEHATGAMATTSLSLAIHTGQQVFEKTGDGVAALNAAKAAYITPTAMAILPLSAGGSMANRLLTGVSSGVVAGDLARRYTNANMPEGMQREATFEDALLDAIMGAGLVAIGPRSPYIRTTVQSAAKHEQSQQDFESLNSLIKFAQDSKTNERSSAEFKAFVQSAKEDGNITDVYIDAKTLTDVLNQSGVRIEELAQQMPELVQAYQEALSIKPDGHGVDVRIPIESYLTHVAKSDINSELMPHIKANPDGATWTELQAESSAETKALSEQATKIVAEKQVADAIATSRDVVRKTIETQLIAAGRSPDEAKTNAAWRSGIAEQLGRAEGITPEEAHAKYGDTVSGTIDANIDALNQLAYSERYEISPKTTRDLPVAETDLAALRREAAGIEKPKQGITFRITEDGKAVVSGPKGIKVPDRFQQFASKHGLTLVVQRRNPMGGKYSTLFDNGKSVELSAGTYAEKPMPIKYREAGALYFGEMGSHIDRTGMTLFQSAKVQTDTPEFRNWFGKSQVVDENNSPLVMYHGTARDITEFKPKQAGAIFLTKSIRVAETFSHKSAEWKKKHGMEDGGNNLMPVYVKAEKLFDSDNQEHIAALQKAIGIGWAGKEFSNSIEDVKRGAWEAIENPVVQKYIKENYDGFHVYEEGEKNIAVFKSEQIKSAIGNRGTFDPNNPNILYQSGNAPTFYSQLSKSISEAPDKVFGKGENVANWINANASKLGIKKAEIEATDLVDWLNLAGKVTKADVLNFLDQNGVQVKEVMLGENRPIGWTAEKRKGGWMVFDAEGNQRGTSYSAESTEDAAIAEVAGIVEAGGTKFASYQLPGGENYKELLLTLPSKDAAFDPSKVKIQRNLRSTTQGSYSAWYDGKLLGENFNLARRSDTPASEIAKNGYLKTNEEIIGFIKEAYQSNGKFGNEKFGSGFRSSHYDQPNIIAHVRMNERTDAEGSRVLFIEEIQSDAAQGKRKGNVTWQAPFIEKTEAWTALALKKMIAYASANGFQKIAWTTGEQQAARYKLSGQVDKITVVPRTDAASGERTRSVTIEMKGSGVLRLGIDANGIVDNVNTKLPGTGDYKGKPLADVIGKDMADRIMNNDRATFEGEGLNVGGEGMKGYYDQIVPQVANDILKKMGGGKVEDVGIEIPGGIGRWEYKGPEVSIRDILEIAGDRNTTSSIERQLKAVAGLMQTGTTLKEAMEKEGSYTAAGAVGGKLVERSEFPKQKGFTLTPALRAKVMNEGLPLFQENRASFNPDTRTITLLKTADSTSYIHETGHSILDTLARIDAMPDGAPQIKQDMSLLRGWWADKANHMMEVLDKNIADTVNVADKQKLIDQRDAILAQPEGWLQDHLKNFAVKGGSLQGTAAEKAADTLAHEYTARGLEAYMMEGKAPSVELMPVFARIMQWMKQIYRELKNLNVELTPEVRGLFDRLIASEDAIKEAESVRGYMDLFKTPEDAAKFGVSAEAFAKIQALGKDATQTAVDELSAKSIMDMRFMSRAKSKAMRALQKEANGLRAEARIEARSEVLQTPIYRAWLFLTRKSEDTSKPPKEYADESLFEAIARLGGIDRQAILSEWGVSHDDVKGKFGKPVLRKEGGRSLDDIATSLGDEGYLPKDENGKVDLIDFEDAFAAELGGDKQYSLDADYGKLYGIEQRPDISGLDAGKINTDMLRALKGDVVSEADITKIEKMGMAKKDEIDPDLISDLFGFESAEDLVHTLGMAEHPLKAIETRTDQIMMERHAEFSTPGAIELAAEAAIHNDVRARVMATQLKAFSKAKGSARAMAEAARLAAEQAISEKKIADLRPLQYTAAEARAGKELEKAMKKGDLEGMVTWQRTQLLNNRLAKASQDAIAEVRKIQDYQAKFDKPTIRKLLDKDYLEQIDMLRGKVDFSNQGYRSAYIGQGSETRMEFRDFVLSKLAQGEIPYLSESLLSDAELKKYISSIQARNADGDLIVQDADQQLILLADGIARSETKPYKNMTVSELRGFKDTLISMEKVARNSQKILTSEGKLQYQAVRDEITSGIKQHATKEGLNERTRSDLIGRVKQQLIAFNASLFKVAIYARVMDGGLDNGAMWKHLIRPANHAQDFQTTRKSQATIIVGEILNPILKDVSYRDKIFRGKKFPTLGISLNWNERFSLGLNYGNESNTQRILGGGIDETGPLRIDQIMPILQSLTTKEWLAIQKVWDHLETYRPEIGALELETVGVEPEWIAARPFTIKTADGDVLNLRGGYYPVKFDPRKNQKAGQHAEAENAKDLMKAANSVATTRRTFVKPRVEEVHGRPLLLGLETLYSGINEVIHDLAWRRWAVDSNKLLRSKEIDSAIREHYGSDVKREFDTWKSDILIGEKQLHRNIEWTSALARKNVAAAGLAFNVMSAAIQPLGLTQSIVRLGGGVEGAKWVGFGMKKYLAHPIESTRQAMEESDFMKHRSLTRFRELDEIRNQVQGETKAQAFRREYSFFMMMKMQQVVDTITYIGAKEKALTENPLDEKLAIDLAVQAVKDSQGGGEMLDRAGIERTNAIGKLFTVYYFFMNTSINMGYLSKKTPGSKARFAVDMVLLFAVQSILVDQLRNALTPGDNDYNDDFIKNATKSVTTFMLGLVPFLREATPAVNATFGEGGPQAEYRGPAGLRIFSDLASLGKQANQGEFDDAFRKSLINLTGDVTGFPAAQANKSITGIKALNEDETDNPAAVVFGYQEKR